MPIKGKHLIHYVPHGINSDEFCPLQHGDKLVNKLYKEYFGVGEYNFILGFNSRNSHRKHPSNLILAFKNFCDHLSTEQASKCALVMHTDKSTDQGTNLIAVVAALCPNYKVVVDESRKTPQEMCAFYNLCDVVANVSSNEGFGLSVAESIMCGTPVIANVTGGIQDQIGTVDENGNPPEFNLDFSTNVTGRYKKHGCWVRPIWTSCSTIQGSPPTPYIMDDIIDYKPISDAIMYWYLAGSEMREHCGKQGRQWALTDGGINSKNMCDQLIKALDYTIDNFTPPKKFDVFAYSREYDTQRLPQDKIGFEMHKIDIESIKKELECISKNCPTQL